VPLDFTKRSKVDAARAGDAVQAIAALKGKGAADLEDPADTAAEDDPSDPTVCCPKCGHEFKVSESAEPKDAAGGQAAPDDGEDFGGETGGYHFGGKA
jgi:hypothetical protein